MDGTIVKEDLWHFPVEMCSLHASSIYTDNLEVPENMARAIVRTDTNQVLGVHGKKYKPITNMTVVNAMVDAVHESGISRDYDLTIDSLDGGAKMRGRFLFNDLVIEPDVGDVIKHEILFYNSYDGSWAFQQTSRGHRLWCKNGCTNAMTVSNTWAKHTTNVNVKGSTAKIVAGLETFMQDKDVYRNWMATSVDDETAFLFFKMKLCRYRTQDASIKINERRYEQLCRQWHKEKTQLGTNKWALYNACTHWATHTGDTNTPHVARRNRENLLIKALKPANWHLA
jgi:hypothetical protein